jgi:hypothetical protein
MKPTNPIAFPGDSVLVENYKCRILPKPIERGRVLETRTIWLSSHKCQHKYIVKLDRKTPTGKSIKLDIQDHRIKRTILNR